MTTESTTEILVHRSVRVPLDPTRAFDLFTSRMTDFWPHEHQIGSAAVADIVIEPHVGGRWYERGVDGSECDWGRVAVWDRPGRLVLLWQISAEWRFDPDLETEVEVTFAEDSPGGTRLELRHRHLERYGDQAEAMRALFESPEAWTDTLDRFVDLAG